MGCLISSAGLSNVDVLIMHAPGTNQGDQSELKAVNEILGEGTTHIISTKHQSGHTLGASGVVSLDLAVEMLQRGEVVSFPYETEICQKNDLTPNTILINAVGFGGNAVRIVVKKFDHAA